ncbi:MAG: PQQ-binding-like beta-propeller repeat protein, partial [Chloroflexi bacterium]|nr:PQQ-binding-like beta-propeller repeat protein [Chloroflexota bacterium]
TSRTATPAELATALRALTQPATAAEVAAHFERAATPLLPDPAPSGGNDLPTGINVRPPRPAADPNAEPSEIERTFARIWSPTKRNRRQELLRAGGITAVCAALIGGYAYMTLRPPDPLPPPSTQLSVQANATSWPSVRRDSGRTGAAPAPAAPFTGKLRWSYWTGDPILSSPVVANGLVFLATGDRRLVALDAASGAVRWEIPTTGPVDSTPAIAGDTLFFGLRDGNVLAINTADGSLRWTYTTGGPVLSSPTVAGGALFVGSGDGKVYSLDAATGQFRWSYETGSWVVAPPAVTGNEVVVGSRDGWISMLDANNGALLFHFFTAGGIEGGPAADAGTVYIGSEARRFWALDLSARSTFMDREIAAIYANLYIWGMVGPPAPPKGMRWINRSTGRFNSMAAIGPDAIYAAAGGANMKTAGYDGGHSHEPGAADNHDQEGDKADPYGKSYSARVSDGVLYAWDRATGDKRWEWVTESALYAPPTLAGDTLYVGSDSGELWALNAADGKPRWSFPTGDKVRSSPAVTADGIYFTSWDGTLYALK